jgi:hypothetical protein
MEFNESDYSEITTEKVDVHIRNGKYFEGIEQAMMKINIWPLIFTFIFAALVLIGNSIVIYIYWQKWKKTETRVFILTLGVLDWLNCAFNMPVEIVILWLPLSFDLHYLCKISRGCTFVINNTGSLVLVSKAIEVYCGVSSPQKQTTYTKIREGNVSCSVYNFFNIFMAVLRFLRKPYTFNSDYEHLCCWKNLFDC